MSFTSVSSPMLESLLLLLQVVLHLLVSFAYVILMVWAAFHFRKEIGEIWVWCTSIFRGKKNPGEVTVDSPEKEE